MVGEGVAPSKTIDESKLPLPLPSRAIRKSSARSPYTRNIDAGSAYSAGGTSNPGVYVKIRLSASPPPPLEYSPPLAWEDGDGDAMGGGGGGEWTTLSWERKPCFPASTE